MKVHIGVDESLGLFHSIATTPANQHDVTQVDKLLHCDEKRVWNDASYVGVDKREGRKGRDMNWLLAIRPGKHEELAKSNPLAIA